MENNLAFIGRRLAELREKNGLSQHELAEKIGCDPTVISKVESGKRKKIKNHVDEYIQAMKCSREMADEIMRAVKIAVPDTSALLYNARLIDDLCEKYDKVVVPDIIIKELQNIKDKKQGKKSRQAWQILRSISEDKRIVRYSCDNELHEKNDIKIIAAVKRAVNEFGCGADIITNDTDYSALLKGDEDIKAIHVKDFIQIHHNITNMLGLDELDHTYLDDYSELTVPTGVDINEYLPNGNTLIISTIRNNRASLSRKKKKIEWLIKNGADINKRDRSERYFPPITHTIQLDNYNLFIFLLNECHANPNVGSKNPYSSKLLRQQNEGNMPLMVAAWHGREEYVKALCDDPRTSINQQDFNGFTALIKAAIKGWRKCCQILLDAGADTKIVDHDDMTAADRFEYVAEYIYEKETAE